MKNVTKILAALLCAVTVFSLSACGGQKDTESQSEKDTSTVSEPTVGSSQPAPSAGNDIGDGIVLPEEAKIPFGKDNNTPEDPAGTEAGSGKDGSAKPGGKDPGKDPGKSDDNSKSTGSNTSETSKPTVGDGEYGGIQWNK